jgi:signal transduction histidine kinase
VKITKKERQLDEISRIQSHEVRKPVANIIALVNLIEDEPDWAAKNSEVLEMLKSSAEELDNAIKKVVLQIRHENDISLPA